MQVAVAVAVPKATGVRVSQILLPYFKRTKDARLDLGAAVVREPTYKLPEASHTTLKVRIMLSVPGNWLQVKPASVDFQTPFPYTASALLVASPVDKYIIFGCAGSWQIEEIAKLSM